MAQRGGPLIHKKLHICLYRSDNLETVLKFDPLSRTELAYTELMIEVTGKPTQDFFVDSEILEDAIEESTSHEFPTSSNDSRFGEFVDRAWGQHTLYVTEIIVRQCRVCVFSIALFGSRARLFRWDRAGCVVSAAFDVGKFCVSLWGVSRRRTMRGGATI